MVQPLTTLDEATLLVVDDEDRNVELLVAMLERDGYRNLQVAYDVDTAMDHYATHRPDLVLLDLHMKPADGFDAMARIRQATPRDEYQPIMVLTADASPLTRARALAEGAHDFLLKPFDFTELSLRVRNLLSTRRLHCFLHRRNVALEQRLEVAEQPRRAAEQEALRRTSRVRRVLDNGNLGMVFQPIEDLSSGQVVGFEALARIIDGVPIAPDVWFDEAATVGLGVEAEVAAVSLASSQLGDLPDHAFLSVNVSEAALESDAFGELASTVDRSRLVAELTEHSPIADYAAIGDKLAPHRRAGLRLAVDDTGAGYASLQHILRLEPDVIKLDRSLIVGLDGDASRRALVAAMVHFASETGATVVAEGIETPAELHVLRDLGVRWGQGYLLGRPTPIVPRP